MKLQNLIVPLLLGLLVSCATVPAEPRSTVRTVQGIADEIGLGNYKVLATWIHANLRYKTDRTSADEWKEPELTLKDGTGDCEDFALLAIAYLNLSGVQDDFILGVSPRYRNNGHVVCFFRTDPTQNWQYYSNDDGILHQGPKDFKDLPSDVGRMMRYGNQIDYQLASRDNKNITPAEEVGYGLRD